MKPKFIVGFIDYMFLNLHDDSESGSGLNEEEVMALIAVGTVVGIGALCFIRLLCTCRNYQQHTEEVDNTSTEALYEEASDNYHVQIHPRTEYKDTLESVD